MPYKFAADTQAWLDSRRRHALDTEENISEIISCLLRLDSAQPKPLDYPRSADADCLSRMFSRLETMFKVLVLCVLDDADKLCQIAAHYKKSTGNKPARRTCKAYSTSALKMCALSDKCYASNPCVHEEVYIHS